MTYLVGVDSGGTHTNVRLLDSSGTQRTIAEIDKSLTSNRSHAELTQTFADLFASVQAQTMGSRTFMWINAAGYSGPTRSRFERLLQTAATGFDGAVGICNDAVGLLLARNPELVGVIAGTGSVAMARDLNGNVVTRGGDEWVVADYGSAFWIGLNGIRAAYQALEGGTDTSLLTCLVQHYSPLKPVDDGALLHEAISEIARRLASLGTDTKPTIASFAREVTRQAELGDDAAQKIVRASVDELAAAAARVYREIANTAKPRSVSPRFLLSGSVGHNSRFYFESFKAALDQFLFDVRETTGAGIELLQQLNGLADALTLARCLSEDEAIPALIGEYPYSIVRATR